ncbi:acetyltransferase (GNAT) domain-containing protein [Purpureocillium lavendulum]|uniref:Acetyltransferase (GNAT) domain-containing protein n=1 Tax=Purpureocillium lavendulum TaxID=1247861 RepID=A0AB34G3F7_9HYPO|nr:acetyltransferase (GNAT) domain-containing protein [Purpureocillium lavendulum]
MALDAAVLEAEIDAIFGLDRSTSPATLLAPDLHAVHALSSHSSFLALAAGHAASYPHLLTPSPPSSHSRPHAPPDHQPPSSITQLRVALGLGVECVAHGPSYVFPATFAATYTPHSWPLPPGVDLITSASSNGDGVGVAATALVRPGNWEPGEWADLTAGALGPWAMAVVAADADAALGAAGDWHVRDSDEVSSSSVTRMTPVSICFCARRTPSAAEAGIWTHPAHRGRRIAPAVVAAWAGLTQQESSSSSPSSPLPVTLPHLHDAVPSAEANGRRSHHNNSDGGSGGGGAEDDDDSGSSGNGRGRFTVFYSTSADNAASQAVARRLGLAPFARIWKLHARPVVDGARGG